jgi:hypothetical protein
MAQFVTLALEWDIENWVTGRIASVFGASTTDFELQASLKMRPGGTEWLLEAGREDGRTGTLSQPLRHQYVKQ